MQNQQRPMFSFQRETAEEREAISDANGGLHHAFIGFLILIPLKKMSPCLFFSMMSKIQLSGVVAYAPLCLPKSWYLQYT